MSPPDSPTADRGVVIVGAGGHGRELFDAARTTVTILGFVDDVFATGLNPEAARITSERLTSERLARLGAAALGPVSWLEEHPGDYALGIGTSAVRRQMVGRLAGAGCSPVGVTHPGATVGSDVRLGEGVVIYDRTTLTTNVEIGDHTHLNVGCAVQHDTVVGSFVQVSPGVFINGDCRIGDDVFLGTGAVVTRGCTVGDGARIGAGAVVLEDVAPGETVVGIPAAGASTAAER